VPAIHPADVALPLLAMYTRGITLRTGRCHARGTLPDVLDVLERPLPEQYSDALERSLTLLSGLFGAISQQLFGHVRGAIEDDVAWFDFAVAVAAEGVGLVVPVQPD